MQLLFCMQVTWSFLYFMFIHSKQTAIICCGITSHFLLSTAALQTYCICCWSHVLPHPLEVTVCQYNTGTDDALTQTCWPPVAGIWTMWCLCCTVAHHQYNVEAWMQTCENTILPMRLRVLHCMMCTVHDLNNAFAHSASACTCF